MSRIGQYVFELQEKNLYEDDDFFVSYSEEENFSDEQQFPEIPF